MYTIPDQQQLNLNPAEIERIRAEREAMLINHFPRAAYDFDLITREEMKARNAAIRNKINYDDIIGIDL